MKIRPMFTACVISLIVAACSSFQAYDGPPRLDSETALIQTTSVAVDSQVSASNVSPARSFFTSVDMIRIYRI